MKNQPTGAPAEPAGALYYPTPVTPEEAFHAIGRFRKEARDEIDRLIRFLDKTDNYVSRELEDSAEDNPQYDDSELEPSLGFLENHPTLYGYRRGGGNQDCISAGLGEDKEGDANEDDEDGHDHEGDELLHGGESEREDDERDGGEEPSLGWTVDGVIGNPTMVTDGEEGGSVTIQ